jgi:hypothetical protein
MCDRFRQRLAEFRPDETLSLPPSGATASSVRANSALIRLSLSGTYRGNADAAKPRSNAALAAILSPRTKAPTIAGVSPDSGVRSPAEGSSGFQKRGLSGMTLRSMSFNTGTPTASKQIGKRYDLNQIYTVRWNRRQPPLRTIWDRPASSSGWPLYYRQRYQRTESIVCRRNGGKP